MRISDWSSDVCSSDLAFRILVQPADREDPPLVADEIDDVALHRRLGGAGDDDRLVQRDVDVPALAFGGASGAQGLAGDLDLVALADLGADTRALPFAGDPSLPATPLRPPPRADAGVEIAKATRGEK